LKELGADRIDVLMPYFVYSRQDKIFRQGEPLSAKYVLELMKSAGATGFYCISSHLHREEGKFDAAIPAFNISGFGAIADYLKILKLKNPMIIGPDKKSGLFAKEVAEILHCESTFLEKKRDLDTGNVKTITKLDLSDRDAVIVDDIVSSGVTLINAIENLKNPNKVICAVVHPVLTGDCLKRVSAKSEFVACNTIDSPISKISVVERIANFIS
jgi:ribose-phosphate pyrophosphokinase